MVKLKIECWWTDTTNIHNRFLKQFIQPIDLKNYSLVNTNQDYTIVLGNTKWENLETPKERTFYFSQEPLFSPNQPKKDIHNYCSKIFVTDKREYPNEKEYIETMVPMLYSGRGEMDNREEWDWSYNLKNKKFEKEKIISIIVRKDASEHYQHLCNPKYCKINYSFRTFTSIELSKNEMIDVYGNYWENNQKNIKGEIWNKHIGLDNYMFSVAFENSIQKNYISEKFWDLILTDVIPIYHGCNNIKDHIPENSFINLTGMDKHKIINKIEDVIKNYSDYHNFYKKNVLDLKSSFFENSTYNLWEKIKKEILNV